jgi:hypothetical protein
VGRSGSGARSPRRGSSRSNCLHKFDDEDEFVSWRADVGFVPGWPAPFPIVLGQVGFLGAFTLTLNRLAALAAIEDREVFDTRFGTGSTS